MVDSFLEKLKKGMDAEEKTTEEEPIINEPEIVTASEPKIEEVVLKAKVKPKKTKKVAKPKKKAEKKVTVKKIKIKEEEEEPINEIKPKSKEKSWFEPEGQLTIDVYQTNGEIVIQSAVAGIRPENLDILIENDIVTITGNREKVAEKEDVNYFYQECYWGRFSRKVILPAEVNGARAEATMKQGVLTIRIPKIERDKKQKIIVNK